MEVKFDEKTVKFALVGMTFDQLNTVLNCIAFATEHGARMPKKQQGPAGEDRRRASDIETRE